MKTETGSAGDAAAVEIRSRLGADRVLEPLGALPQPADRLDPSAPVRPYEFELAVERLCLDSTSHRNVRDRCAGDPQRMSARILGIVEARGKMHNPETDSGGILVGTVSAVGDRHGSPPPVGERVAALGSLTLTPLRLERITGLDPDSQQVRVEGTAYVFERAGWAPIPDDLPLPLAVELFDVCAAANQTEALTPEGGTVYVLGAGHAGRLALAAARKRADLLVAVDVDAEAVEQVVSSGLCDIGVVADLRDPLGTLDAVRGAKAPPADLCVLVVNAGGCEPTALLLTNDDGAVLFFSMATSFGAAALAPDGLGTGARMLIGSGRAPDGGAYALELVRSSEPLREALALQIEAGA
ncbi:MAG: L-erythro-3,5-diaminohexanoate dehydrogenase [Vicinamibacteria bacterium]